MPPNTRACTTLLMESEMNPACEYAMSTVMSGNSIARIPSASRIWSATATVLAPDSLYTSSPTASAPL